MRDYYTEFLEKKSENIPVCQVSKVSKGLVAVSNSTFDTFDTELNSKNPVFFSQTEIASVLNSPTGEKVIEHLSNRIEQHKKAGVPFISLYHPTIEALEAEVNLIEAIKSRELSQIESDELKRKINHFIEMHDAETTMSGEWTGEDVPLYYIRLLRENTELDACTCNVIQAEIIKAVWRKTYTDINVKRIKL